MDSPCIRYHLGVYKEISLTSPSKLQLFAGQPILYPSLSVLPVSIHVQDNFYNGLAEGYYVGRSSIVLSLRIVLITFVMADQSSSAANIRPTMFLMLKIRKHPCCNLTMSHLPQSKIVCSAVSFNSQYLHLSTSLMFILWRSGERVNTRYP